MTIHLCRIKGIDAIAGDVPIETFRQSLIGRIQYVIGVNPKKGKQLLAEFESL
jgi:hypothetical protein